MKKGKLLIPFAVMSLACGLSAGVLAGCGGNEEEGPHSHDYQWVYEDESGHWQECKLGDSTTEKEPHELNENGDCECGYSALLETVSGTVSVEGGALSGVSIKLKNASGNEIAVTDYTYNAETGAFSFKAPVKETGATEYILVVKKEGCIDATGTIEISKGEPVTGYNITLTLLAQIATDGAEWDLTNAGANGSITKVGGGYGRTMSVRNYSGNYIKIEQKIQLPQSVIDAGIVEGDQYGSRQGFTVLFEDGDSKADWYSGDFTLMTRDDNGTPYTQIDVTDWKTNGCGNQAFGWGSINNAKRLSAAQEAKYVSEGITLSAVYADGAFDFFIDGEYFGSYEVKQELKDLTKLRFGVCSWLDGTANYVFNVSEHETFGLEGELPTTFEHGTLSYDKPAYGYGDDMTITVTPEEDYELKSLKLNGVDYASDLVGNTLVIENVKGLSLDVEAAFGEAKFGTASVTVSLCKDGTTVSDKTGLSVKFGKLEAQPGENGVYTANLSVSRAYVLTVSKEGYDTFTQTVELKTEGENPSFDVRLEYVSFEGANTVWEGWHPTFKHTDDGHVFTANDGATVATKSTDGFDDVAVTLTTKTLTAGSGWEGIWMFFESGEVCPVGIGANHRVEWDMNNYGDWGGSGLIPGANVNPLRDAHNKWQPVDKDGNDSFTAENAPQWVKDAHAAGTLQLTLVRKGSDFYLFLNDTFVGKRTVDAKYATQKVNIGFYAKDCGEGFTRAYSYTTDVSEYLAKVTPEITIVGAESAVNATLNSAEGYGYGDEMTLTVTVTDTERYYLESVKIGGKVYSLDANNQIKLPVYEAYEITVTVKEAIRHNVSAGIFVRKAGTNTALANETAVALNGNLLDEEIVVKVVNGSVTFANILAGEYTVSVEGYADVKITVNDEGAIEGGIVLQFPYASAVEFADRIDLSKMNESAANAQIAINGSIDDNFWQWGDKVPEVALNLSDNVKNSKTVKLEFNLKADNANNHPNNAFGIVLGAGYKGLNMSFWNTTDDQNGVVFYALKGKMLGNDEFSPDENGTNKWLETALYSANGVNIRAVRSGATLKFYAQQGEEWIAIFTTTCAENDKTDIRFMGCGSDFVISAIEVDENYQEQTVNLTTTLTVTDQNGALVTLEEGTKGLFILGGTEYEVELVKADNGYTISGNFVPGIYTFSLLGKYVGYVSPSVNVTATAIDPIELTLGDIATATDFMTDSTDGHWGMDNFNFKDLVNVADGTIHVNTSSANGKVMNDFCRWGVEVPEAVLNISDEVKNAKNVQLDFNLKATNPNGNSNAGHNNAFGIVMTAYKGVGLNWGQLQEKGINVKEVYAWKLGENGWGNGGHDFVWLEELAYGETGVNLRAIRSGATLKFFAQNAEGKWIKIFETTCDENAKTDIRFLGMGSDYTISAIKVDVLENGNIQGEYSVTGSFAEDKAYGYKIKTETTFDYFTGNAGSATVTIETDDADDAWSYFPNAITVNGTAIDFSTVTRESLGANRCKYTFTVSVSEDTAIVVTVAKGTKVAYNASVNNDAYGTIACDMDKYEQVSYYWNDLCILTVTANAGYELEKLVIGEGADAVEITAESSTTWTQNRNVYTYSFTVTGDTKVVAHFKDMAQVTVNVTVSAKDTDGETSVTLAGNTEVTFTSEDGNKVYTYTQGGEAITKMAPGKYYVTCEGFCNMTVTVGESGGDVEVLIVKAIATSTSDEITIGADRTITVKGNGQDDRDKNNRKISAELVLTEEEQNATELTLTFNIKRTKKSTIGGDAWAASRFGIQIGEGELGYYLFMREAQDNAADVAKLIPGTNLSLNPDKDGKSELKWHGNDSDLKWLSDAVYGESGLNVKVIRSGGVLHIWAQNGTEWVQLDVNATKGETPNAGDAIAIADNVKNQIKLTAGGDDFVFSQIEVKTTADDMTDPA